LWNRQRHCDGICGFAANVTPDATGMGTWSADQFIKTISNPIPQPIPPGR
jgi:hypothetical protein